MNLNATFQYEVQRAPALQQKRQINSYDIFGRWWVYMAPKLATIVTTSWTELCFLKVSNEIIKSIELITNILWCATSRYSYFLSKTTIFQQNFICFSRNLLIQLNLIFYHMWWWHWKKQAWLEIRCHHIRYRLKFHCFPTIFGHTSEYNTCLVVPVKKIRCFFTWLFGLHV